MAPTRTKLATCDEESVPLVAPLVAEQKHAAHRSYAKVIAGGALATLGAFACFANPRPTVNLNAAGVRLGASSGEFTLHTGCSPLNKLSYGFSGAGTVGARIVSKSMSNDFRFEQAVEMKEVSCGNYAISDFPLEEGEEFGFYLYPIGDTSDETTVLDDGCLHEGDARCPAFASPAALVGGECTVKYTDPGSDDVFYNRVYDGSTTAYTWGSCEATCAVGQPDGCPAATGAFSTAVALNDNGSATTADIGEASFNEKFAACPVVKYVRNGVDYAFYTRTSDIPSDFNAYSIFTYTWANSNNVLGLDFEIYSSFEDLKSGSNKWSFCNYNDADVGFPRDCGPNGAIWNTWFSFPGGEHNARGLTSGSSFELWDGSDCPSTATPITYTYTFEINKNVAVNHMEITKILIDGEFPETDSVTVLLQQNAIRDGSDKTVMLDNIATSYMQWKNYQLETGTQVLKIKTLKLIKEFEISYWRPRYAPGWRILLDGQEVLKETENRGSDSWPSPATFTYDIP